MPEKKLTAKKALLFIILLVLYLVTSVPVGLFLYSVKSEMGLNVFSDTGFHSYMHCLREEAYKATIAEKKNKRAPLTE